MKLNKCFILGLTAAVALLTPRTLRAAETQDGQIETSFKDSMVYRSYLTHPGDAVSIQSNKGQVVLKGTVTNEADKNLAEATASDIPGVKGVDNQLQVTGEKAQGNSDGWIATKVKTTLMFHKNVSGTKTNVEVNNGVVKLSGEADSEAQKELTAKYAEDIDGVKEVKNEISVVRTSDKTQETVSEKFDDASITAQVKTALLFHRSTSAIRTTVKTQEGIVTVNGKAKNTAERDLVTQIVTDIHGVINVVNNMTIEGNSRG